MKAKTNVSKAKSRRGFTLVEMIVVIGMIAALAGISFPVYKSIQKKVEKQRMEMMFNALDTAVENFMTEYNYLPYIGANYPGADAERGDGLNTEALTNEFITVLVGLGNTSNFKKIKFFEYQEPSGAPGNYKDGLLINGASAELYLPWGVGINSIWIDYDLDGSITHPYYWGGAPAAIQNTIMRSYGPDGLVAGGPSWATDSRNLDNVNKGL